MMRISNKAAAFDRGVRQMLAEERGSKAKSRAGKGLLRASNSMHSLMSVKVNTLHPESKRKLAWDMFGALLLLFDVVAMPL